MHSPPLQTYALGDFVTLAGLTIRDAHLAFKTWGDPTNPLIVYPTPFSARIEDIEWLVSRSGSSLQSLDPSRFYIVSIAQFGNAQSSSPSNTPGKQAGVNFPATSMYDARDLTFEQNVRAQHQLITQHLGCSKIFAVVGWSMGACQTFQWGASYPGMVERIVPFCGAARTAEHNQSILRALSLTLQLDPVNGRRAFSAIFSGWEYSQTFYRERIYETLGFATLQDFYAGFWDPMFATKDTYDLLHHLKTWIEADITLTPKREYTSPLGKRSSDEQYRRALSSIKSRALVMPGLTDLYFPPADSAFEVQNLANATLAVIPSSWGHCCGEGSNPRDVKFIDDTISSFFERTLKRSEHSRD